MMPRPGSMTEAVLRALRNRRGLTAAGAFQLGCTHLASIVLRLRRSGFVIDSKWQAGVSRYGRPIKFKKYRVLKPQK